VDLVHDLRILKSEQMTSSLVIPYAVYLKKKVGYSGRI